MKYLTISAFLMLIFINIAAGYNAPTDLLLESRVKAIENYYKANTDSLQRELTYYKAKEDYYAAALGEQATRFGLIIAGLLTFAGLVGWGWFSQKLRIMNSKLDKKINEINEQFSTLLDNHIRLNADTRNISASTIQIIAERASNKGDYATVFRLQLYKAKQFEQIIIFAQAKEEIIATTDLFIETIEESIKTLEHIQKTTPNDDDIQSLKEYSILERLTSFNNNVKGIEVENVIATCRVKYLELTKK